MTAEILPFDYQGREVRTLSVHGEPWFVAADVCAILGYRMASDATRWLDDDEKGTHPLRTPGGVQQVAVVSEAGLYSLTLRSQVENAKAFKRWITHEVLPAIRKSGHYGIDVQAIDRKTLAQWLIEAENAREAAEAKVAELEPVAAVAQDLIASSGDYSVDAAAKILCRAGINTGERKLFATLRQIGWAIDSHTPYQRAVNQGRLAVRASKFWHEPTQEFRITRQIRVTPKGLAELHRLLGGNQPLALVARVGE